MAIEVACGSCQGRMMAEAPGSIVACPHCGAHLTVPADPNAPAAAPQPAPTPEAAAAPAETAPAQPAPAAAPQPVVEPPAPEQPAWMPNAEADEAPSAFPDFSAPSEEPATIPDFSAPAAEASPAEETTEAAPVVSEAFAAVAEPSPEPEAVPEFDPSVAAPAEPTAALESVAPAAVAEPEATPTTTRTTSSRGATKTKAGGVSRQLFVLVASYACAVTAIFVYAYLNPDTLFRTKVGELENLRDIKSKPGVILGNGGKLPESSLLEQKQKLKIGGEPQRLGNIEVSIEKITKGEITLLPSEHMKMMGGPGSEPMKDGPVLQLWLKFKNVSEDQQFAPIDYELLGTIKRTDDIENPLTDTFIAKAGVSVNDTQRIPPYYNLTQDIQGLPKKQLNPGDEVTMLVPSNLDGVSELTGDLIWRVRFRKGLSPKGNGVTTLVDVEFNANDIQSAG